MKGKPLSRGHNKEQIVVMQAMVTRRKGVRFTMAVVAAMTMFLAACSSSDSSSDSAAEIPSTVMLDEAGAVADDAMEDSPAADDGDFDQATDDVTLTQQLEGEGSDEASEEASNEDSDLGAGGSTAVSQTASEIGRKIIFTADLTVEVTDVADAGTRATEIIEAEGGFLFGQETQGGSEAQSILTFKVDPARFDSALEKLGGVGELRNQTVSADDVTGPIVDLESRIEVAELGVERLKAALVDAPTLEDYAEIEQLLITRESELAVMRGQLRTLQSQVDLATITVALVQDRVVNNLELAISAYEGFDGGANCPGESSLRPEAETDVTICFELVNSGDQTLTDVTITDTVLEIDEDTNLIAVFDTLDELAPGQSAVVAFETAPERFKTLRTRVTAIPTDGSSGDQVAPTVTANGSYDLRVFGEEDNPGFGDGFSAAVGVLSGLWVIAKVLFGFILPMLIFLPFLWLAWRGLKLLRSRRPAKPAKVSAPSSVPAYAAGSPVNHQPPPPAPMAAPVPVQQSPAPQASAPQSLEASEVDDEIDGDEEENQ